MHIIVGTLKVDHVSLMGIILRVFFQVENLSLAYMPLLSFPEIFTKFFNLDS